MTPEIIAIKYIGQEATEDTPAFTMAQKGDKLLITEIIDDIDSWAYKAGYRYVCQDIKKNYPTFYVGEEEIGIKIKEEIR